MWRGSFLVNLQACRLRAGNFINRWTLSQVFFNTILTPPHAPPMDWLKLPHQFFKSPPKFSTPVGNPEKSNKNYNWVKTNLFLGNPKSNNPQIPNSQKNFPKIIFVQNISNISKIAPGLLKVAKFLYKWYNIIYNILLYNRFYTR